MTVAVTALVKLGSEQFAQCAQLLVQRHVHLACTLALTDLSSMTLT
jgi:hypothetical protein